MSKLGTWSTTAGNNNTTPPDGWPENQAPSTVNDCAREMMASIRTYAADAQFFDKGNTPSYLTATTFSLGAADTEYVVGRRVKLFDASTLYGTINSVSATFVSVRLDSGALTVSLSSVALAALSPVNPSQPEFGPANRNMVINGNMDVWQRAASLPISLSAALASSFLADRFFYVMSSSAAVITGSRGERSFSTNMAPTLAQAGQLLNSCICLSMGTADTNIGANEYAYIGYRMEGYDWRQIAHRPNILSFWAYTNVTGTYCVSMRSTNASACFVANYTLAAAATWQRFAITVPEAPTTVTWDYSSGVGVLVTWTLATGSTFQGDAGNWTAGANALLGTSSQTNFLSATGSVFKLTGVDLRAGTNIQPLATRPYAEELALCQRYFWRGKPGDDFNFGGFAIGAVNSWNFLFPTPMRGIPTLSASFAGATFTNTKGSPTLLSATLNGYRLVATASAVSNVTINLGASDYTQADAEL